MRHPWAGVRAVLLDAGNTLVSIDFPWLGELLAAEGIEAGVEALRRAEAAARPALSRRLASGGGEGRVSTESGATFTAYVEAVLTGVPGLRASDARALAPRLARVLKSEGNPRLWSLVLPGTREALAELAGLGLRLAVVSNSDGTIRETLERLHLAAPFAAIVDSAVVGHEKPDPRIFAPALDAVGAAPQEALYVGDLYAVDVVGARAAGLHAALVDPFGDWDGVDCERVSGLPELASGLRSATQGL